MLCGILKKFLVSSQFVLILFFLVSCSVSRRISTDEKDATHFVINKMNKMVLKDISVNGGTATGDFLFITYPSNRLVLDKSIAYKIFPNLNTIRKNSTHYLQDVYLIVGGKQIKYSGFEVDNILDKYKCLGILSIPQFDAHAWYIKFSNCTIKLEDAPCDKKQYDYSFRMAYGATDYNGYYADFLIRLSNGTNSIKKESECLHVLDTGSPYDFVLIGDMYRSDLIKFLQEHSLSKHKDKPDQSGMTKTLFRINESDIVNDLIDIEYQEYKGEYDKIPVAGTVGLGFFKRFNIVIDLTNNPKGDPILAGYLCLKKNGRKKR